MMAFLVELLLPVIEITPVILKLINQAVQYWASWAPFCLSAAASSGLTGCADAKDDEEEEAGLVGLLLIIARKEAAASAA